MKDMQDCDVLAVGIKSPKRSTSLDTSKFKYIIPIFANAQIKIDITNAMFVSMSPANTQVSVIARRELLQAPTSSCCKMPVATSFFF